MPELETTFVMLVFVSAPYELIAQIGRAMTPEATNLRPYGILAAA